MTACSSSYSLGDMITVGLSTDSNAVENIREYGEFTVNVPCQQILSKVEICRFPFRSEQNWNGGYDV